MFIQQHLLNTYDGDGMFLGTEDKVWTKQNTHPCKVSVLGSQLTYWKYEVPMLPDLHMKKKIYIIICVHEHKKIDSIICLILSLTSVKLCNSV